jgi:hypothetical protein
MAVLEWPADVCPASLTWRPESNTKTFRSPLTVLHRPFVSRHPLDLLPDV